MKTTRQVVTLELPPGSRECVEEVRQWNGMTQKELVGRLIAWFGQQDRVLQQLVLGQIPAEVAPDVARTVLRRIAEAAEGADEAPWPVDARKAPCRVQDLT